MQYRHEARQALARATALLLGGDDHALRYVALELRLTLEASVYDRLHDYRRDVPPSLYETWQPPKVLRLLLEIEPNADRPSTTQFTRHSSDPDVAPRSITFSETPVDLPTLKANYDALGSYLHMPTRKQFEKSGGPDLAKLRKRCETLAATLDPMVMPPKNTFIGGTFTHCECFRCGADMRKRLAPGVVGELVATCLECEAPHRVLVEADGTAVWTSVKYAAHCAHEDCGAEHGIFPDELKDGHCWTCGQCGGDNFFELGLWPVLPRAQRSDQIATPGN